MMNEYIIDPATVYFWNVSDGLRTFFMIFLIIASVTASISTIGYIISVVDDDFPENVTEKQFRRFVIICWMIVIFFALGRIFLPDKQALIEMTMAKLATRDNIQWTSGQVKELADYVAGLLK